MPEHRKGTKPRNTWAKTKGTVIEFMLGCGNNVATIAKALRRSESTISRGLLNRRIDSDKHYGCSNRLFGGYARSTVYGWIEAGLFAAKKHDLRVAGPAPFAVAHHATTARPGVE